MATLAEVDSVHVAFRSVNYLLQDRCPQCAVTRRYVHYVAPDRIRGTWFGCNPVAERERSDLIQVRTQAYHRQPRAADGSWVEREPVLTSRSDAPGVIGGWLQLPSADGLRGGSRFTTAFHIPDRTTITIQGRARAALLLPIETQLYPPIVLPGIPLSSGPALGAIEYRGSRHRARRIIDSGSFFVDALTAHPLRYLSTVTAIIDDTTSVVVRRSHVRFWYGDVPSISLPHTPE
jgi:hypothetical protein